VEVPGVVLDTNVLIAALRSRNGASFRLLSLVGTGRFEIGLSVPLVLEYEDVLLRNLPAIRLGKEDVDSVLDYLCAVGRRQDIFFLWRPHLPDAKDDMVLELAVAARCDAVITFNQRDFVGIEAFGLRALTPRQFLAEIGETP
jgi:putative PIN family toxin of toxin-antitoxin system